MNQNQVIAYAAAQLQGGVRSDAMRHALDCIDAVGGWTVETLGHNIQSEFGCELDADECDYIARAAIARATGADQ